MKYQDFLNFVIDDGIEAARRDYTKPEDSLKLEGSIQGFNECRGLRPHAIAALVTQADQACLESRRLNTTDDNPQYWFWACRRLEIHWVANVVSAMLHMNQQPLICVPSLRGTSKAMEILGSPTTPAEIFI